MAPHSYETSEASSGDVIHAEEMLINPRTLRSFSCKQSLGSDASHITSIRFPWTERCETLLDIVCKGRNYGYKKQGFLNVYFLTHHILLSKDNV